MAENTGPNGSPREQEDLDRLAPEKLVTGYSRSNMALALILAIMLHVVVIGATSIEYIDRTWVRPEYYQAIQAAKEKAEAERLAREAEERRKRREAATQKAATQAATQKATTQKDQMTERDRVIQGSEMHRKVTGQADPNDLPTQPDVVPDLDDLVD